MRAAFLLSVCLVLAGGELETPSAGYSRGADGTITRISGSAGAFVTSATTEIDSIAASFSGRVGVLKRASSIRVLDANGVLISEADTPPGAASLGFNPRGDSVIAYYPSTQTLAVFGAGQWRPVPFDAQGIAVLAVALQNSDTALALVLRDQLSLVSVRITDGAIVDETLMGDGAGPAIVLPDRSVLFIRSEELVSRDAAGTERAVAIPSGRIVTLSRMDSDWIHARTESGGSFAFRLESDIRVYELPGVPQ